MSFVRQNTLRDGSDDLPGGGRIVDNRAKPPCLGGADQVASHDESGVEYCIGRYQRDHPKISSQDVRRSRV